MDSGPPDLLAGRQILIDDVTQKWFRLIFFLLGYVLWALDLYMGFILGRGGKGGECFDAMMFVLTGAF